MGYQGSVVCYRVAVVIYVGVDVDVNGAVGLGADVDVFVADVVEDVGAGIEAYVGALVPLAP